MTSKTKRKNIPAEDSLKGGAPDEAKAERSAAAPAAQPEAVASDATSATDTEVANNTAEPPVNASDAEVQEQGGAGVDDDVEAAAGDIPEASSSLPLDGAVPSDHIPQVDGAAPSPLPDARDHGATGAGGPDAPANGTAWIVTCTREGGRRRAGRRWAFGPTRVTDLDEATRDALETDPSFTLQPGEA